MKTSAKRLLAAALALVMILSVLPVMAFAEGEELLLAEGSATFTTKNAAFNGKAVTFTPETNGEVTVTIPSCTPGFYVDVWEGDEWLTDLYGNAGDALSFDVTAGTQYRVIVSTYDVSIPPLYDAAAGSISYKITMVAGSDTDQPDQPGVPVDPSTIPGATPENPKILTTADWVFFEAGQTVWYLYDNYENMMANGAYSMMLHIHAGVDYSVSYKDQDVPVDENGFVNYEMIDRTYMGQYLFCVTNESSERAFFSVEVKDRPQYVNNGDTLKVGPSNKIVLDPSATFTLYEFTPSKTGVYTITAKEGVVGDWGIASNPQDNTPDKTNTLTWTCTAVGQSILVGFTGADTTTAIVARIGDYTPDEEIPWVIYEQTYDFSYEIPTGAVIVDVDLTDGGSHTAVLGEDGFYHYGSAEGPVMVIDLTAIEININDAYTNGGLRAWIMDGNKQTISKVDYNEAMFAYHQKGMTPVTAEMATMLSELGTANGWWQEGGLVFTEALPQDMTTPWMQLCSYIAGVIGDVTGDGKINMGDVSKTFTHVRGKQLITDADILLCADVTGDGKINMADIAKIFAHVKGKSLLF